MRHKRAICTTLLTTATLLLLCACSGTGSGTAGSGTNMSSGKTTEDTASESKDGVLISFYYSPGYSDMEGAYYAERIERNGDGEYVYLVTERRAYDAPEVTTTYAFDENGMEALKNLIDRYDITALAKRRESDEFMTDYSPWSYSFTFDDSETGGSARKQVSFDQYRKYREKDLEHLDELLELARSLRGEQIAQETTGGEETDDGAVMALSGETDMAVCGRLYGEVLEEILTVIREGYDVDREYAYLTTGLMEAIMRTDPEEALRGIGYLITDLSGDQIPELLIGEVERDADEDGSSVYSCYTCENGKLILLFEGYERSRYQWMGGNSFFYSGSSGAANSALGVARVYGGAQELPLMAHHAELVWDDFYFTEWNGTDGVNIYYNKTGEWNTAESEQLQITENMLLRFHADREDRCMPLPLTPIGN